VLTLHNVGYQGNFPRDDVNHSQLGWSKLTSDALELGGRINYLKAGILNADKINTVSPTYAQEIKTPAGGAGLDGVLRMRSADLLGVVNGCDYREWNPSVDPQIAATFDADRLTGKKTCKQALRSMFDLEQRDVPVVAMVSRLAHQKGIDVLAAAIEQIAASDVQLAILGTGETWAHFFYGDLPKRFPGKIGCFIGFDQKKSHACYAGADFFLIPSRYEPCGLTQLISKRYGTLPIARATGGLVDTIVNYDEKTGGGDGFLFHDLTPQAIVDTVRWAVSTYRDRPEHLKGMIDRAMRQRFSWTESARRYHEIYGWAIQHKRGF
jgi:starch synthase